MTDSIRTPGRVTVGVPTRNRAPYVMNAVRSVLAQTYDDLEIVISDNCSTDDTVRQIESIGDRRIVLLRQARNLGMVGNFNACLAAATGELFLLLSDDDHLEPTAVERISAPLRGSLPNVQSDQVGLSWCPCRLINARGVPLWTTASGPELETSLSMVEGHFNGKRGPRLCSIMVRTADILAVGGYDEARYGLLCDMGMWTRAALRYPYVACVPEPLASYRMHPTSLTSRASFADWRRSAENLNRDLEDEMQSLGNSEAVKRLRRAAFNHVSNEIASILIQTTATPGKIPRVFRELAGSRRYLLSTFVAGRILREGWKLLRWWSRAES